jgi:gamma-glutamyltranspeptidase/glutathione hydrolase
MPRGRAPQAGERFANPHLARSLEKIAASQGEAFYRGELAEAMVRHANAHGNPHALTDFAQHSAEWVTPLAQNYRDATVHEIPPNGQGIAALIALGILEHFDLAQHAPDSVQSQHLQIEAMKLAFADAYRYVADPRSMPFAPKALLDRDYLAARAKLIDPARAQAFGPGAPRGGTVYLCAADEGGMMVSLIQSNYMGFGSGVVVPGTGLSLQNRGAGFVLTPGHPNQVAGGKRPYHTIIPGFVTRNGAPLAAFGVMGGPIQPPGHVQVLTRMLDYGLNPQAAIDAPRWKLEGGLVVDLEPSASPQLRAGLAALGHQIETHSDSYLDFGAGQCLWRTDDGYIGGSDSRRDGQTAGF